MPRLAWPVVLAALVALLVAQEQVVAAGMWGAVSFVSFAALSVPLGPFSSWMIGNAVAYLLGRSAANSLLRRFVR